MEEIKSMSTSMSVLNFCQEMQISVKWKFKSNHRFFEDEKNYLFSICNARYVTLIDLLKIEAA
jgi:hypothetical protein